MKKKVSKIILFLLLLFSMNLACAEGSHGLIVESGTKSKFFKLVGFPTFKFNCNPAGYTAIGAPYGESGYSFNFTGSFGDNKIPHGNYNNSGCSNNTYFTGIIEVSFEFQNYPYPLSPASGKCTILRLSII